MINLLIGEHELRFVVHLSPFLHVDLGLCHSCSCLGMYLSCAPSAFGGSELQVVQPRICDLRKSGSDLKAKAVLRNHIGGLVWRLRTSGQACQACQAYQWFLITRNKTTSQIQHLFGEQRSGPAMSTSEGNGEWTRTERENKQVSRFQAVYQEPGYPE